MKKIFFLLFLSVGASLTLSAQSVLDKAGKVLDVLPIGDVGETANGILGVLKPKLGLNDTQGSKILPLLSTFLQSKSSIIPLAKSNPASYTTKLGPIKDKLFTGLKTALTVAQFKSLLSSKPAASDAGNLLSHLFF